jgi:hypothetical protein
LKNGLVRQASSTDPSTWGPYDTVYQAYEAGKFVGVGRILTEDYVGLDFDNCRDPQTGEIDERVWEIIRYFDSYTEISPSGKGVKIWIKANLAYTRSRIEPFQIEVYPGRTEGGRYFVVTGQILTQVSGQIESRQDELTAFMAKEFPEPERKKRTYKGNGYEGDFDLALWLECHEVEILNYRPDERGGIYYIRCPWYKEHTDEDISGTRIGRAEVDGGTWFKCHHAHCAERDYHDFRDKVAPKMKVNTEGARGEDASEEGTEDYSIDLKKANQADRLIAYALDSGAELFADQFGAPHAFASEEALALNTRCYNWLRQILWEREKKSASAESLKQAAGTLGALVMATGVVHELHTRAAFHEGTLYYQLGKGRVVKVDSKGWGMCASPPVRFRSVPNLKSLPDPVRGGSLKPLNAFSNLKSARDKRLIRAYATTVPLPHIARPMLETTGVMGSGKTTIERLIKRLWDPTAPETVRLDPRDFLQKASHSYIVMLDNQNSLPEWAADTLCRLVTGESDSKRALYTDDEDIIVELKRTVLLNGINTPSDRPDVRDRTLPIELDRIPDRDRKPERKLWVAFDEVHASLLGAAFDALSATMRIHETLEVGNLPRLADWGEYAAAAYEHFGWGIRQFREDWLEIVGKQNQDSLDGSAVAQVIISIMQEHTYYEKSPSALLEVFEVEAEKLKINIKRDKKWPGSPTWVWRRIKEVIPALNAMGIQAENTHTNQGNTIILKRDDGPGPPNDGPEDDPEGTESTESTEGISGHSSGTTLASIEENGVGAGKTPPKSDTPRESSINAFSAFSASSPPADEDDPDEWVEV